MKQLKKTVLRIIILANDLKYFFLKPTKKRFIHTAVPYYSQWESPELIEKILSGQISAEDDPKWQNSGAKTKLDYLNWSWNACGITCLQMILGYKLKKKIPLVELCEQALSYDCFHLNKKAYESGKFEKSLDGLYYRPFISFIKKDFKLTGKIIAPMVLNEIVYRLSKNEFIMASVGGPVYGGFGGHLVLITGYDLDKQIFYINDPSATFRKSYQTNEISFLEFIKKFGYRGMSIST